MNWKEPESGRPWPGHAVIRLPRETETRGDIAREQLPIHRAKLAGYETEERLERGSDGTNSGHLTVENWRGQTLRMGVLYERAAVDFWEGVTADALADEVAVAAIAV